MKLLLQFPTYKRPQKFLRTLTKYLELSSAYHDLIFNVNADLEDGDMLSLKMVDCIEHLKERFGQWVHIYLSYFPRSTKISAINNMDGVPRLHNDWDTVICLSDDMIPQVKNWDEKIFNAMEEHFPALDGAIHYNDGYQGNKLITLSILGRKLYEHFGYIYHPDYKSLYCDNEFTQEVYRLGKVKYIDEVIIKHEHYGEKGNTNSGQYDEAAQKTLFYAGRDGQVFERRKALGFPKERITND